MDLTKQKRQKKENKKKPKNKQIKTSRNGKQEESYEVCGIFFDDKGTVYGGGRQ